MLSSHPGVYGVRSGASTTRSESRAAGLSLHHGLAAGHNLSTPFLPLLGSLTLTRPLQVLVPFGKGKGDGVPWGLRAR